MSKAKTNSEDKKKTKAAANAKKAPAKKKPVAAKKAKIKKPAAVKAVAAAAAKKMAPKAKKVAKKAAPKAKAAKKTKKAAKKTKRAAKRIFRETILIKKGQRPPAPKPGPVGPAPRFENPWNVPDDVANLITAFYDDNGKIGKTFLKALDGLSDRSMNELMLSLDWEAAAGQKSVRYLKEKLKLSEADLKKVKAGVPVPQFKFKEILSGRVFKRNPLTDEEIEQIVDELMERFIECCRCCRCWPCRPWNFCRICCKYKYLVEVAPVPAVTAGYKHVHRLNFPAAAITTSGLAADINTGVPAGAGGPYYNQAQVDQLLAAHKNDAAPDHDGRYYTEPEVNSMFVSDAAGNPPSADKKTYSKDVYNNMHVADDGAGNAQGTKVPDARFYTKKTVESMFRNDDDTEAAAANRRTYTKPALDGMFRNDDDTASTIANRRAYNKAAVDGMFRNADDSASTIANRKAYNEVAVNGMFRNDDDSEAATANRKAYTKPAVDGMFRNADDSASTIANRRAYNKAAVDTMFRNADDTQSAIADRHAYNKIAVDGMFRNADDTASSLANRKAYNEVAVNGMFRNADDTEAAAANRKAYSKAAVDATFYNKSYLSGNMKVQNDLTAPDVINTANLNLGFNLAVTFPNNVVANPIVLIWGYYNEALNWYGIQKIITSNSIAGTTLTINCLVRDLNGNLYDKPLMNGVWENRTLFLNYVIINL